MFTIQSLIIDALLIHEVTKIGDQEVKIGKTYDEVLEIVKNNVKNNPIFEGCDTTKNCVTWYASKMRNQDTKFYNKLMLEIQRPRKSSKASKAPQAAQVAPVEANPISSNSIIDTPKVTKTTKTTKKTPSKSKKQINLGHLGKPVETQVSFYLYRTGLDWTGPSEM